MEKESTVNSHRGAEEEDVDPVEFLLDRKEYHDWKVTLKDPSTGTKKEFGVISHNLAAHSKVFRTMMSDPKWINDRKLVIPDMSPQTFNLIYRYVNAGDLGLDKVSREDIAQLALAADMFMIPRLVKEACKCLVPSKIEEIFPALHVVSFISNTDLEPHVVKFVSHNAPAIMKSAKFLDLDLRCIEFIVKQEYLSLSEVEIWTNLVKWARHQVAGDEEKTLRSVLGDALKYVRFRTLTQLQIVKEVSPTKVLTSDELSSLLCAVIGNEPWNQPGLCDSQIRRSNSQTRRNDSQTRRQISEVYMCYNCGPYEYSDDICPSCGEFMLD